MYIYTGHKKNNKIEEKTIRYEGKNYEISRKKRDIHIYIYKKKKKNKKQLSNDKKL